MDLLTASHAAPPMPMPASGLVLPAHADWSVSDVTLHHLVGERQISTVKRLRGGIDLSVHTATPEGEREFARLEKKETSAVSSFRLTSRASL